MHSVGEAGWPCGLSPSEEQLLLACKKGVEVFIAFCAMMSVDAPNLFRQKSVARWVFKLSGVRSFACLCRAVPQQRVAHKYGRSRRERGCCR